MRTCHGWTLKKACDEVTEKIKEMESRGDTWLWNE